jgi:N-acetyl-alpha-D-muramate 1-phosphate uridylyltransferase
MKAMILAAGLGSRLGPITDIIPKALLPVQGEPLIFHHLYRLKEAGFTEVVINLHHLGHYIQEALGHGERFGLQLHYSIETTLLGTAGGVAHALPLLGQDPFLLLSSDIFTDFPLLSLPTQPTGLAHLVLVPNPPWHVAGDFCLQEKGYITLPLDSPSASAYTYGNIGVFNPALFANLPQDTFAEFGPLIRSTLATSAITGELYTGNWANVGTLDDWVEAHMLDMTLNCV